MNWVFGGVISSELFTSNANRKQKSQRSPELDDSCDFYDLLQL